jgi:hypothetical protein
MNRRLLIILGPTAVGKTDYSIEMALKYGSPVISCDSRQIYKEMSIGTAVPSEEQLAAVKHYFIHSHSVTELYTAGKYELEALELINSLFDDVMLTELFVPSTEIKPIADDNGDLVGFTEIPTDEIYIKLKNSSGGEFRMSFFDFSEDIQEAMRFLVIQDMGQYEWECLYVDDESDQEELKDALSEQRDLITQKYGSCEIKESFDITSTINIINQP